MLSQRAIDNMSHTEVINHLNSGQYIPSSVKRLLEEKLELEKKTGKISGLDEFFALIGSKNTQSPKRFIGNKQNKSSKSEDFPTMETTFGTQIQTQNQTQAQTSTNKANSQTKLNFNKFTEENGFIKSDGQSEKSLFTDDKLIIDYQDICQLYDSCAIYRIRMQYLILNRKIHLLDSLFVVDQTKGNWFKTRFDYNDLCKKELQMKNCIQICGGIDDLTDYISKIGNLLNSYRNILNRNNLSQPTSLTKLKSQLIDIQTMRGELNLESFFSGELHKYSQIYLDVIKTTNTIIDYLNRLNDSNSDTGETFENYSNLIDTCHESVDDLINKIVTDTDPHLKCDYYVEFDSNTENFMTMYGLANNFYLDCENEIDLSTNNLYLTNPQLVSLTERNFRELFDEKFISEADYFISIWTKDSKMGNLYMCVSIADQIPFKKGQIEIVNYPPDCGILTSMLRNPDLESMTESDMSTVINPSNSITENRKLTDWLNSTNGNQKYSLTGPCQNEYNLLKDTLQYQYSVNDTNKNGFFADYLFTELSEADIDHSIIRPEMLESFRELVRVTSSKNSLI